MPLLLNRPPLLELLPAVSHLLRTGLPPLYAAPEWVDRGVCPAGHWLVPAGTRLYYADEIPCEEVGGELLAVEFATPGLVLSLGEAEQMSKNSQAYWRVPLVVDLIMDRQQNRGQVRGLMGLLQRVLTEELPTGNPATQKPWARLTSSSQAVAEAAGLPDHLLVFTCGIRDVKPRVLRNDHHHPMITLECTINCGTATAMPAAV